MADGLSTAASVIGVMTLAAQASKLLYEFISGIADAPKELADITTDLKTLNNVLDSLVKGLKPQGNIPKHFEGTLTPVKEAANACKTTCDDFKDWLAKVTKHSEGGRTSRRDRVRLHFEEKNIAGFKNKLQSFKATLVVALDFMSLESITQNTEAVRNLESNAKKAVDTITGQIQGLAIAMEAMTTRLGVDNQALAQVVERQAGMLAWGPAVCLPVLEATAEVTGNTVKYAEALDEARQLVGVIGDVQAGGAAVVIEKLVARDKARQMGGVIAGNVALEFMK